MNHYENKHLLEYYFAKAYRDNPDYMYKLMRKYEEEKPHMQHLYKERDIKLTRLNKLYKQAMQARKAGIGAYIQAIKNYAEQLKAYTVEISAELNNDTSIFTNVDFDGNIPTFSRRDRIFTVQRFTHP